MVNETKSQAYIFSIIWLFI